MCNPKFHFKELTIECCNNQSTIQISKNLVTQKNRACGASCPLFEIVGT